MSPHAYANRRAAWLRHAASLRRQINIGWWLDSLSTPLLAISLVAAAVILVLRREFSSIDSARTLMWLAIGLLLLLAACLVAARRHFQSTAQMLVRMEAELGLNNALSAAEGGVAPWPDPPRACHAGLNWNWPRLLIPPLASLTLLAAGLWLPVHPPAEPARPAIEAPPAWAKMTEQLDLLVREQVIDEPTIQENRRQLAALMNQAEDRWFSHPSLEATDALAAAQEAEIRRLAEEVTRASRALDALAPQDGAPAAAPEPLSSALQEAIDGLDAGAFKPNPELMKKLRSVDPSRLNQAPGQLGELRQALEKHSDCLGQCLGEQAEPSPENQRPTPSRGGTGRGPRHVEELLGSAQPPTETGKLEGVQSQDLSNARTGDLLELQSGEHQIPQDPAKPLSAGRTPSQGQGGARIWQDTPDPAEQRTLKRFFK